MAQSRRDFLRTVAGFGGLLLTGFAPKVASPQVEAGRRALAYCGQKQAQDGAWRAESYAAFRDGDALTPVVLWALQSAGDADESFTRGLRWLERLTDAQNRTGDPWAGLHYPLFTAAYSAQVLAQAGDLRRAGFWADVIERLRTSPALGWPADAPACGAWSDSPVPPRYAAPVPDMLAPNLSATVLALQALQAAGRGALAFTARPFVECCQNFASEHPESLDDGGFFFAPDDPIRNKAGSAGRDAVGRERFRSYGSATCDGILAMRACGIRRGHPRLCAAIAWLRAHRAGLEHPGAWPAERGASRASLVFYHAQAHAAVLAELAPTESGAEEQRSALVANLLTQQAGDGSWRGAAPQSCEDEPLLATAFALRALNA